MNVFLRYSGYLISLIFLYITFRDVEYGALAENINHVSMPLLLLALIVNILFFTFRALYQNSNLYFLKSDIPFAVSITAIAKAQFYNVFLPARIGELLRVFFCPVNRA